MPTRVRASTMSARTPKSAKVRTGWSEVFCWVSFSVLSSSGLPISLLWMLTRCLRIGRGPHAGRCCAVAGRSAGAEPIGISGFVVRPGIRDPLHDTRPRLRSRLMTDPLPDLTGDPEYREAVVDLLGALAYGELTAFSRLAADAELAPSLADKAALARQAVSEFRHYELLEDRLRQLGADVRAAMQPFVAAVDAFHDRTRPSSWLEGLVKANVGDGIATDFYKEVAAYLDD